MLSIHAVYDSTGNTGLTSMTTAAGNEKAPVTSAGITPIQPDALPVWLGAGVQVIATADAVKEVKLISQDMWDPVNYSDYQTAGTSVALASPWLRTWLRTKASRLIQYSQKAAGAVQGYSIDAYPAEQIVNGTNCSMGSFFPFGNIYKITASGAVTAGTWREDAWSPTSLPSAGRYAILGLWAYNYTATTGLGLVSFNHADFKGKFPGVPVTDSVVTDIVNELSQDPIYTAQAGYQFVWQSLMTGAPQCPVFHISDTSTGLVVRHLTMNADTPTIALNLQYLGA